MERGSSPDKATTPSTDLSDVCLNIDTSLEVEHLRRRVVELQAGVVHQSFSSIRTAAVASFSFSIGLAVAMMIQGSEELQHYIVMCATVV